MDALALTLLFAGAIGQTAFVAWYGLRLAWWRSWVGRALFTKSMALAVVFDTELVAFLVGKDAALVEIGVLALVVAAIYFQLVVFIGRSRRAAMTESVETGD